MKKSNVSSSSKSAVHVGSEVYLEPLEIEPGFIRKTPDNRGKKYFKWDMVLTNLLLKECLDKEVWTITFGKTEQVWMDVCCILRTYPNYEKRFETLTWRKCEDEYNRNVKLYQADRKAVPFQSGTDAEHTEWEDLMEELFQKFGDKDMEAPSTAETSKQVEKDLKVAGELFRDDQLSKFSKKRAKTSKMPAKKNKASAHREGDLSDSSVEEVVISPTDRLALALAQKFEAEAANQTPAQQTQNVRLATGPTVSDFSNIREIIIAAGIQRKEDVDKYVKDLESFGFETPFLCLGLRGNLTFMIDNMKMKPGHAITLMNFMDKFET